MLRVIFLREVLDGLVSRKLLLISLLAVILIPLSALVNQRAVASAIAQQNRAMNDYERSLEGLMPADQIERALASTRG